MTARTKGDRVQGKASPGDRVSYMDCANPYTEFEVIDRTGPAEYMLVSDDGHTAFSDLRQYGWAFA